MESFKIEVDVAHTLKRLLDQEDLNHDYKITVEDLGPKTFLLDSLHGAQKTISGTYPLSNLLQLLAKAHQNAQTRLLIDSKDLFPNPVDALRAKIKEEYWKALTRTLDEKGILRALEDPKTKDNQRLYVPQTDPKAYSYFSSVAKKHSFLNLEVIPLTLDKDTYSKLDKKPGLLSLALDEKTQQGVPFLVPGGRFNEMYGWDSYFIVLGLLEDKKVDLAKGILENLAYQIRHYHGILNANRTYYLSRSNPPFFTSILRELLPYQNDLAWIQDMLELAILDYERVWSHPDRVTLTGLNRYYGGDLKMPLEVEKDHFKSVFQERAKEMNMSSQKLEKLYLNKEMNDPALDEYFIHDRSMRESGHDTTNRLVGISASLNPVDLNSLLFKVESDMAYFIEHYFKGSFKSSAMKVYTSELWTQKAQMRKKRILDKLWHPEKGLFFDYHFKEQRPHFYESATSMYPLFAKLCTQEQASILIKNIIRLLEAPGGLLSSTKSSRGKVDAKHPQRQWDYPFGWAPHQILFWKGAIHYGEEKVAERLAYKWLYMMTKEAMDYAGVIVEKYHVIQRSHKARAEYGNVGMDFQIYPKEGFGWVNASYQIGWSLLSPGLKKALKDLKAPEEVFK